MRTALYHLSHLFHGRDPHVAAAIAGTVAASAVAVWIVLRTHRPSIAELEHRRREHLSSFGRITDGVLLDARTLAGDESSAPTPEVLVYSYRLAGVTYECAQDVSPFPDRVLDCRLDEPVQVRYDPRSPGNSVLISESWSGLWHSNPL